jgi:hypothetical protein
MKENIGNPLDKRGLVWYNTNKNEFPIHLFTQNFPPQRWTLCGGSFFK